MSASKQQILMDGFVRDENGKLQIIPLKSLKPLSGKKNGSTEKSSSARKFIPIEPLRLPRNCLEFSPQSEVKRRKVEKPVRKELFKVPATRLKLEKRISLSGRRSLSSSTKKVNKKSYVRKNTPSKSTLFEINGTPLIDTDVADKAMTERTCFNGGIKTVLFPPMGTISESCESSIVDEKSPERAEVEVSASFESLESNDSEFLQLEDIITSDKENTCPESPMSSVCNLLQNTKISRSSEKLKSISSTIMNELQNLLEEDHQQLQLVKKQIQCYEQNHKIMVNRIQELLNFDKTGTKSREYQERRSDRIAVKSSVSPAISKSVDLRKTTLTKNLTKTLDMDIANPKMKKAIDLYNSIRNDCNVLCTPKINKLNSKPAQNSVTRSLSRRIQNQCLLLQDTPKSSNLSN